MSSATCAAVARNSSSPAATVDFREVRARMDLPRTRILLERGCDKDVVRQLIEERLRDGHSCGGSRDFESASELMAAYLLRVSRPQPSYGVVGGSIRSALISAGDANASFVDLRQAKHHCIGNGA